MPESKTTRSFVEILKDAMVALGVDIAFKEFTKQTGTKTAEVIKGQIDETFKHDRGELLADIMRMDAADTQNLWRRHRKAVSTLQENRFVRLLCVIPKDDAEGRRPTLKYLNEVSDEQFDQALNLLDHDPVMEWVQRMRRNGGRVAENDFASLRETFQNGADSIKRNVPRAAEKIVSAARSFDDLLGTVADWMERHE